jgi:hypothetical protein
VTLPLPRPEDQPTMRLWPETGQLLGLSRSATYEAAGRGEIPVLKFGRRSVVPTAALRRLLKMD